jgi:pyridoxamine 5'-phosphate oxidase
MADPFPVPDDLGAVLGDIWSRLSRGAVDRRSAFHTPIVGSVGQNGAVEQRAMVLRNTDKLTGTLRFHTDVRSAKVAQLQRQTAISIVGYDPGIKVQLRASGTASIMQTGTVADEAWSKTSASGRRSYMTILPPGTGSDSATSGLPVAFESNVPTLVDSEVGRSNFSIVIVTLDRLEWLHLVARGHRRAAFTRTENDWAGTWLIP